MSEPRMNPIDPRRYEVVGWLSITSAILLFPAVVFAIILEVGRRPAILALLIPYVLLFGLSMGLLNDRYQFHDVDNLITAIIILGSVMMVVGIGMKVAGTFAKVSVQDPRALIPMAMGRIVVVVLIGLPLSIRHVSRCGLLGHAGTDLPASRPGTASAGVRVRATSA